MKNNILAVVLVAGLTGLTNQTSAQNLIQNGGFETGDASGWTATGNSWDIQSVAVGQFGTYYESEPGDGTLTQAFATTTGQSYNLDFYAAQDFNGNQCAIITVGINGSTIDTITSQTTTFDLYSANFTATGSTTTLSL